MPPRFTPLFCFALVLAGGCRAQHVESVEHRSGDTPVTFRAPFHARWTLHHIGADGAVSPEIDNALVEREEHVGFVRQSSGELNAYAGGRKIPLEEGEYVWRIMPETKERRSNDDTSPIVKALTPALKVIGFVLSIAPHMAYGMLGGHS